MTSGGSRRFGKLGQFLAQFDSTHLQVLFWEDYHGTQKILPPTDLPPLQDPHVVALEAHVSSDANKSAMEQRISMTVAEMTIPKLIKTPSRCTSPHDRQASATAGGAFSKGMGNSNRSDMSRHKAPINLSRRPNNDRRFRLMRSTKRSGRTI